MILDTTTRSLEVLYETTATTTESDFAAFWADTQTGSTFSPGQSNGATNGSTAVTLVAAPGASTQRQVKEILIYNADTVSHNFTVRINDSSTIRVLGLFTVPPTYTLFYSPERGWVIGSPLGSIGPTGPTGPTGATGPAGSPGPPGADGEEGIPGLIGPPGSVGPAGTSGSTGSTGPQGPIGFGLDGEEGPEGPPVPGPIGLQGATGTTGATGPQGVIGNPGPPGWDGEEGPEGFGIPGATGATGAQGSTGAAGLQGPVGFGMDGEEGPEGFPVPGPQGLIGPAGNTGSTGSTGPQGPMGFGMDGEEGVEGFAIPGPPGSLSLIIGTTTSGSSITPSGAFGQYNITALAAGTTIQIPAGTPSDGQKLIIRFKDNASPQTIAWITTSGGFRAVGVTLPSTTVSSKVLYVGCIYNAQDSFWDVVATAEQ